MNVDKQYKYSSGQIFRQIVGNKTQQFRLKDNRRSAVSILNNRPSSTFQAKCVKNISCMQRKLPDGLTKEGNTAEVWFSRTISKNDGIMCQDIEAANGQDKAETLKNISKKAGDIGAKTTLKKWATLIQDKYKNKDSKDLNPFQVPIKATYPLDDDNAADIKLFYHYGPYNHGYIVRVELGKEAPDQGKMNDTGSLSGNDYSNVHDTTENDKKIMDQTIDQSPNIKFDAYTKLAGEGARFQCVRDNIDKITNNTWFYVSGQCYIPKDPTNPIKKKVVIDPGLTFLNLWGSWANPLGSKFNMSNKELIDSITKGFLVCESATDKTPKIKLDS